MATITIIRTKECASQNHVHLTFGADVSYQYNGTMDDIFASVSEEEKEAFVKVLLRIAKIGRTRNQMRTALTNGYTITI